MKPIKQTTEETGSIHVDSVDVSNNGACYRFNGHLWYICGKNGALGVQMAGNVNEHFYYDVTLSKLISILQKDEDIVCYTLSGQRITLEKELTIADLKDSDHVGFVDSWGKKAYIAYVGNYTFKALSCEESQVKTCNIHYNNGGDSLVSALEITIKSGSIKELYLFDKRTGGEDSLFGWLNS